MKIEVGKKYRTREGDVVTIEAFDRKHCYGTTHPYMAAESSSTYRQDGRYLPSGSDYPLDLVAEIIEPPAHVVTFGGIYPPAAEWRPDEMLVDLACAGKTEDAQHRPDVQAIIEIDRIMSDLGSLHHGPVIAWFGARYPAAPF